GSGRATEQTILTAISESEQNSAAAEHGRVPAAPAATREPPGNVLAHRVLQIGVALADGLAHAHERGILHRDINPPNILPTDDGEPMLLDFNLAADDRGATASVGGTPQYMAPEQLASLTDPTVRIDSRADIYALGLVLHELLTGRLPFRDHTGP